MFETGDIVKFFSPTASKYKFHLCLGEDESGPKFAFLHLNSGSGFRGDYVLDDGAVSGLPKSPTGNTVVSFSMIVRMGEEKLRMFSAEKVGKLEPHVAGELAAFALTTGVLNRKERELVVAALEAVYRT